MYYFNKLLFKRLPSLFGMTQLDFSEWTLGARHKFARRVLNQDTFPFEELVRICNTVRISIADFITLNPNEPFLENKYKYTIPENKFVQIEFQPKNIRFVYGPNGLGGNLTREEFAQTMGIALSTLTRWVNPQTCFASVNDILKICNHYKINLNSFVEDKNKKIEQIEVEMQAADLPTRVWQEITELKQILASERENYQALKEENEQLRLSLKGESVLAEIPSEYEGTNADRKVRKWTVNWNLLENLTEVLGITDKELIQTAGLNCYTSFRDGDILVTSLIKICNKYQMSTRHFLQRYNGITPPLYKYSYYRSEDWKTVVFHPEQINDLFGKDALTDFTCAEIAELNSVSKASIRAWKKQASTMRLSDFVRLCNTLEVTPSCFITDKNRTELSYSMTFTEFLMEEVKLLRQRNLRLNEKLRKQKQEKGLPGDE